ncbi:MAG: DUF1565 domain-containing protein [Patescibacteria group bacterium]|nr:DUF1565 domain-containing protein [Patescibacteria group bacterium]
MTTKTNKKIILITILFLLILSGAVFAFQQNKDIKIISKENQNEISDEVVVENIVYVGEEKLDSSVSTNFTEGENIKNENESKTSNWVLDFINIISEKQKPKIIKVPEEYKSIQLAIDSAKFGDRVEVSPGEYKENIIMKEGVSVIGAGLLTLESQDSSVAQDDIIISNQVEGNGLTLVLMEDEQTENEDVNEEGVEVEIKIDFSQDKLVSSIIDGGGFGNVVTFKNEITSKTELGGFTIINSGKSLSGVFIEDSSPWIHDNVLVNNEYNIYVKGKSSPIIQKNRIQLANKGIQIYAFEKDDEYELKSNIIDNLITDNKIGIDVYQSSAEINHNTISYNNHYKTYLGATYGIYLSKSSAEIKNNIITDNGICELCAGVSADKESKKVVLKFNNIWNNKNNFVCFGDCTMEYNNLSEEPLFIDYINGDYKLSEESTIVGKSEDELDIGIRW